MHCPLPTAPPRKDITIVLAERAFASKLQKPPAGMDTAGIGLPFRSEFHHREHYLIWRDLLIVCWSREHFLVYGFFVDRQSIHYHTSFIGAGLIPQWNLPQISDSIVCRDEASNLARNRNILADPVLPKYPLLVGSALIGHHFQYESFSIANSGVATWFPVFCLCRRGA